MLTPIANHKREAQNGEREQEYPEGRPGVQLVHGQEEDVARDFGDEGARRKMCLAFPNEVKRQFGPYEKEEACVVLEEVEGVVSLISYRSREIAWACIALPSV